MTKQYPDTDAIHWHRQEVEWTCSAVKRGQELKQVGDGTGHIRCNGPGAKSGSLFCALAYFFEHFAHDALLKEFPSPKDPIETPTTLPALSKLPSRDLWPSRYLRWLAVLVGDSQPLHWMSQHSYGKDIKIAYQNKTYTLLSFWEQYIPQNLPDMPTPKSMTTQFEARQPQWWQNMPTELFREWGKETSQALCDEIYAALEVPMDDGSRGINTAVPFQLSEEMYQRWRKLAMDLTTLAGERLAFVFLDILEHQQHKAMYKEGRGRRHRRKNWASYLGTNAAIAAVLVPGSLYLLDSSMGYE